MEVYARKSPKKRHTYIMLYLGKKTPLTQKLQPEMRKKCHKQEIIVCSAFYISKLTSWLHRFFGGKKIKEKHHNKVFLKTIVRDTSLRILGFDIIATDPKNAT